MPLELPPDPPPVVPAEPIDPPADVPPLPVAVIPPAPWLVDPPEPGVPPVPSPDDDVEQAVGPTRSTPRHASSLLFTCDLRCMGR